MQSSVIENVTNLKKKQKQHHFTTNAKTTLTTTSENFVLFNEADVSEISF